MNCTEVFNYIFESFNSNNIDYVIIHSYQYLPDRFDSDIDTAINVPNIKDAIKLLDDTLVGTGWRVIQFWRHENYAADCVISNDDEFLQVDFCTHYERNGRVVIPVQELLDGKRVYKNFYIPKPQTEFTYVLVKKILKKVFSDGSKQRLTALWKAMNEKERQETKASLKRFIAEDQINEILECVDSSQYDLIDLERAHQLLKKKTSNVADNLHYKVFDLKRRFERIVHPTGLFIVLLGVDGAGKTTIAENLKAIGRSDLCLKLEILKKAIGITMVVIAMYFGVFAIAVSAAIFGVISMVINILPNKSLIDYSIKEQLLDIFPALLSAVIMGVGVYFISYLSLPVILGHKRSKK